jgi:hypothetical protein
MISEILKDIERDTLTCSGEAAYHDEFHGAVTAGRSTQRLSVLIACLTNQLARFLR